MTDVHIEFAHIYQDQPFSQEQIDSIQILKKITKDLAQEGRSYQTSVLIDDYHIEQRLWEQEDLIEDMQLQGVKPDFLVSESSLYSLADKVVDLIPPQFKRSESFRKEGKTVTFYVNGDKKFALKDTYRDRIEMKCVSLSCAWMLMKLGVMKDEKCDITSLTGEGLTDSKGIIVVLDKKYMAIEENVLELLACLGYQGIIKSIQYVFH